MNTSYTHFAASTAGAFPLYGEIDAAALLMLANNGSTPHVVTSDIQAKANRLRECLTAGSTVTTASATIRPLTAEEYARAEGNR
jgi:hypothetical protein